MAEQPFAAIEEYFQRMHREFIWPTVAPASRGKKAVAPDKLELFQVVLMQTYAGAVSLFQPGARTCRTDSDCPQDCQCKNGQCVPVRATPQALSARVCQIDDDCAQDELCISGVCTPPPSSLRFAGTNQVPQYGDELRDELLDYYRRILAILVTGLGRKPSKLSAVRNLLMQAYAQNAKIASAKWKPCSSNGDCADGEVCVDGVCVPVPFRLVFRSSR